MLNLAAARAELELAAPVDRDAALLAEIVEVEEAADGPEARRLRVQAARGERKRVHVFGRVDRRIPGDPVLVRREHRLRLVDQARILEPHVGKPFGDGLVRLIRAPSRMRRRGVFAELVKLIEHTGRFGRR